MFCAMGLEYRAVEVGPAGFRLNHPFFARLEVETPGEKRAVEPGSSGIDNHYAIAARAKHHIAEHQS